MKWYREKNAVDAFVWTSPVSSASASFAASVVVPAYSAAAATSGKASYWPAITSVDEIVPSDAIVSTIRFTVSASAS